MAHGAIATEVGPKVPNRGAFVQPTILTNVTDDNPARNWEFFGPVSMLFRAEDEDDAVRIANDSPFGLGGSVFTSTPRHGAEVAKRISTGMVFVNHPTMVKADLPFGASAIPARPRVARPRHQGIRQPQAYRCRRHRRAVLRDDFMLDRDPKASQVWLVGGGIASMAAAVFLIRDADVRAATFTSWRN